MLRGVTDTNVLVSGLIARRGVCGQLLDAAFDGQWQLVVSPLLLAELEDVLRREKFSKITAEEVDHYIADIRSRAEVVPDVPPPWGKMTRDPDRVTPMMTTSSH